MKYRLTIFFIILAASLIAQNKEELIRQLGHDDLSLAGQDTIYKYAQSHYKELWLPSINMLRPRTMAKTGLVFQEFFTDKLTAADMALIIEHWRIKQQVHDEKILAQAPHFVSALNCQQHVFDSLLYIYLPLLTDFAPEIEANLTSEQKALLAKNLDRGINALRKKGDEFLDYAKEFNSHVSTASEEYMRHGFAIMEVIPSSYYYGLVSHNRGGLGFTHELKLDSFFNVYGQFMDDVLFVLDHRKCRGTPAIPAYHAHLRENDDVLKEDALLFAAIHFLEFKELPDIIQAPKFFVERDSTSIEDFSHNNFDRLSKTEISEKATLSGFTKLPAMGDDHNMYAFMGTDGLPSLMFGTKYFDGRSDSAIYSIIDSSTLCLSGWRKVPEISGKAYLCEEAGIDDMGSELTSFTLIIPNHKNSVQVAGVFLQPDETMIYHLLDLFDVR